MNPLQGKKIAILVTDGFEQSEMAEPKRALENEGAKVDIISPSKGKVKSWKNKGWGDEFVVDIQLESAQASDYQALVLPGGVMNPDALRINSQAVQFVKEFVDNEKPIAAICHGPWTLINAEGVNGRTMTSWPSLKVDLENAGAIWLDEKVVRDGKLVTSRKPDDLPDFNAEFIKLCSEN